MRGRNSQKRNFTVAILTICLCVMAVCYAALTRQLNINGTATVTGVWDIEFTNITSNPTSGASNVTTPSGIGTTSLTFSVELNEPGDKMEYTVTVTNLGNIDAIVESIDLPSNTNQDIKYTVRNLETGQILKASKSQSFKVIVEFDINATSMSNQTRTETITVNYAQAKDSNITPIAPVITIQDLKRNVVTTGDGLYADSTEPGRYIYRGANPDNYITFNNESWRILSIESDNTLKIIRSDSIGNMSWDAQGTRNATTDTYCTYASSYGCNAWASTSNLVGSPNEFVQYRPDGNASTATETYSGTVTRDASLNSYLNGDSYYNSESGLKNVQQYILKHDFYVSTPGSYQDAESIALDVEQEKQYVWNGYVGLPNITEYLKTTTNSACISLASGYDTANATVCGTNNWLKPSSGYMWTMSPYVITTRDSVWYVHSSGFVNGHNSAYDSNGVRPDLSNH